MGNYLTAQLYGSLSEADREKVKASFRDGLRDEGVYEIYAKIENNYMHTIKLSVPLNRADRVKLRQRFQTMKEVVDFLHSVTDRKFTMHGDAFRTNKCKDVVRIQFVY